MEFVSLDEVRTFFIDCPRMEELWASSDIRLIKFWLDVSKKEQARRFKERESNPLKLGKLTPIDMVSQEKWKEYTEAEEQMFSVSDNWIVVKSDCKRSARIACMQYVLLNSDYAGKNLDNVGTIDPNILKEQNHGD